MIHRANWIWSSTEEQGKDLYHVFRRSFTVDGNAPVMLQISADSTYAVCINGVRVPVTQFSDFPHSRTYCGADISALVKSGENTVTVEVHYWGESFSTYLAGRPYLKAVIFSGENILAATDGSWKTVPSPAYRAGLECKVTSQLGFAFEYNADTELPPESEWKNAAVYTDESFWHELAERPIPQLLELPMPKVELRHYGLLFRANNDAKTFAEACTTDYLRPLFSDLIFDAFPPCRSKDHYYRSALELTPEGADEVVFKPLPAGDPANGYYLIADLGAETVGWPVIKLNAPAGTVIDIAHGEHLEDGRCRAELGGRHFTDRYICREGVNEFIGVHRRIGARYVELHITGFGAGQVSVQYAGVVPLEVPLGKQAAFETEDSLMARINKVSVDTLKLCMHEHYEDCPWREQALYAYDSRNQIHYGYYVWGNYDFVAASLELLAKSYRGDGYLTLTAPGAYGRTIPAFTFVWISELREHWMFSGSGYLFEKHMHLVDEILDKALARRDAASGLYYSLDSKSNQGVWNFYEWRGDLYQVDTFPQCPYNVYLCEALRSAAAMHSLKGHRERAGMLEEKAAEIGRLVEEKFYDRGMGAYRTADNGKENDFYELVQMIMLYNRLVPAEKVPGVIDAVYAQKFWKLTYSSLYYMVNAMMAAGPEARAYLDNYLMAEFSAPVLAGATSLWETEFGCHDFGEAGSLCHAWSSVMPYYCGSYLLGVKPLEPGFRTFELKIYPGHLTHASGSVPTPHGEIKVSWRLNADRQLEIRVEAPAGLTMVSGEYEEFPVKTISS